jgi:hypothetical protein
MAQRRKVDMKKEPKHAYSNEDCLDPLLSTAALSDAIIYMLLPLKHICNQST